MGFWGTARSMHTMPRTVPPGVASAFGSGVPILGLQKGCGGNISTAFLLCWFGAQH